MPEAAEALAPQAGPPDTATRILDAAEALFVERGFSATSVRAIAECAGVNLGATHYHFGSKEGLLGAVVHRHFGPINEERGRALDALLATDPKPGVRAILDAFFAPLADSAVGTAPQLMARLLSEPPAVSRPLIESEFIATFDRFAEAFGQALPDVEPDEIRWRFQFAIGAMIHAFAIGRPLATPADPHFVGRLAAFSAAGIEGASDRAPAPSETAT